VTSQPYEIDLTRTVRRAMAERLPLDVVIGASEFINGSSADNPHRVGKELGRPYHGVYSAQVMQECACSTLSTKHNTA
jgi:mRNA interferase RelE/StbE